MESSQPRDNGLCASHLVDLVAAILVAPLSDETTRLVRERVRKGN